MAMVICWGPDAGKKYETSDALDGSPGVVWPCQQLHQEKEHRTELTQLIEHVRHIFPVYEAVAVAIQDLKCFPHCPDLRGLQLREGVPIPMPMPHRSGTCHRRSRHVALRLQLFIRDIFHRRTTDREFPELWLGTYGGWAALKLREHVSNPSLFGWGGRWRGLSQR
jgi:hypothetical protein